MSWDKTVYSLKGSSNNFIICHSEKFIWLRNIFYSNAPEERHSERSEKSRSVFKLASYGFFTSLRSVQNDGF